jgi:ABC-type Fe3+/spermidine/putrescine transport system ATPase subunit
MAAISIDSLSKSYQQVTALDDISIEFREGEFFALLGPSGSGKTTLLRSIAGFVLPDSGSIRFDGQPVENIPVHRRDIGMVFQNYALFPHMTVFILREHGVAALETGRCATSRRGEFTGRGRHECTCNSGGSTDPAAIRCRERA